MSSDADKKKLLEEYTAAVAEERASWRRVNDMQLPAVECVKAYARWKAAADLVKTLAVKLRNAAIAPSAPPE